MSVLNNVANIIQQELTLVDNCNVQLSVINNYIHVQKTNIKNPQAQSFNIKFNATQEDFNRINMQINNVEIQNFILNVLSDQTPESINNDNRQLFDQNYYTRCGFSRQVNRDDFLNQQQITYISTVLAKAIKAIFQLQTKYQKHLIQSMFN